MITELQLVERVCELTDWVMGCSHEEWDGIPEVDATCKSCGIDEVSQSIKRDHIYLNIMNYIMELKEQQNS